MNSDPIEEDLARLQPRVPSASLTERIGRDLACPAPPPPAALGFSVAAVGWAAAAGLVATLITLAAIRWLPRQRTAPEPHENVAVADTRVRTHPTRDSAPSPVNPGLRLTRQANYLVAAEDGGWLAPRQAWPVRQIRCQYVDASLWRDETRNVTYEVYVPRDETLLVPVRVY